MIRQLRSKLGSDPNPGIGVAGITAVGPFSGKIP
jgi:hypothetical protein